jgi:hypothetical protein
MQALIGYLTENCCAASTAACDADCKPAPRTKPSKRAARAA